MTLLYELLFGLAVLSLILYFVLSRRKWLLMAMLWFLCYAFSQDCWTPFATGVYSFVHPFEDFNRWLMMQGPPMGEKLLVFLPPPFMGLFLAWAVVREVRHWESEL